MMIDETEGDGRYKAMKARLLSTCGGPWTSEPTIRLTLQKPIHVLYYLWLNSSSTSVAGFAVCRRLFVMLESIHGKGIYDATGSVNCHL